MWLRLRLREKIWKILMDDFNVRSTENKKVLNLSSPLKSVQTEQNETLQISISHSPSVAGFCIAKTDRPIGLDLEATGRVQKKTLKRVFSFDQNPELQRVFDLSSAKDRTQIWCILEATLKACPDIKVLSDISGLSPTSKCLFTFYNKRCRLEIRLISEPILFSRSLGSTCAISVPNSWSDFELQVHEFPEN